MIGKDKSNRISENNVKNGYDVTVRVCDLDFFDQVISSMA